MQACQNSVAVGQRENEADQREDWQSGGQALGPGRVACYARVMIVRARERCGRGQKRTAVRLIPQSWALALALAGTGSTGQREGARDTELNPTRRADSTMGLADRLDASVLGLARALANYKKGTFSLSRPDSRQHKTKDSLCSQIELDRDRLRYNGRR